MQARNYRRSAIILFYIIQLLFFCGQGKIIAQEIETISINNLRQHMDSIASDATEGRFTGSPGYKKAAQYAADIFREAGLNPGYTNEKGEIIINRKSETNIPGIFAAGDVADAPFKQAITGVAEGVIAAYSAFDYLKEKKIEY